MVTIPEKMISSSEGPKPIPVIAMGTATVSVIRGIEEVAPSTLVEAIKVGYRHFDTAAVYRSEKSVGEAVAEALRSGLIKSRSELFITTKLWCNSCDRHLVVPAIKQSLKNLGLEYVDLYLIHWPLKVIQDQDEYKGPAPSECIVAMDVKAVWEGMEECQNLGLTKSIGVSNFSSKKIEQILSFAKIPPAVNQISLRWLYEQGVSIAVKSFNTERMKQNLDIFDWSLTQDELNKIEQIPQQRNMMITSSEGPRSIPVIAMGTAVESVITGVEVVTPSTLVEAIKVGYRHFDTAAVYRSENSVGEAIEEAIRLGLIKARSELFITTKLWCNSCDRGLVVPAIKQSLKNLGLEYVDLYLIHWPLKLNIQDEHNGPIPKECIAAIDMKAVWEGMEECQTLGLTKSIGVSNFSSKRMEQILSFAKIPPAVNQIEMNPHWQQKKIMEFCKANGILVTAYSPLGGVGNTVLGHNRVMECDVLQDIAKSKGKTVAQVLLILCYL
ncbi:hypothetical protein M8C21_000103 [Ambrosia artemisiifolia]|uniref:NADP-dependent oxidoreductase domain-containing protein n=1 Tax=Ambrosia artemisiifolia TaxID=4212 RepID=A0AAD5CX48_AMBAR|nr:hypothetical protein M8C21_000103 [Ambrosia artemisiifolia]